MESQDGVSDEHPGSTDDTAPLTASDGATWLPPREQQPPHQWTPPGPAPAAFSYDTVSSGRPYPPPGPTHRYSAEPQSPGSRGRVPGWMWPVV